jgi:hypothetical protein
MQQFCVRARELSIAADRPAATVEEDADVLEDYLENLPEHFADWPLEDRYLSSHTVRVMPCNWKVALEAFIEAIQMGNEVIATPEFGLNVTALTEAAYESYESGKTTVRALLAGR